MLMLNILSNIRPAHFLHEIFTFFGDLLFDDSYPYDSCSMNVEGIDFSDERERDAEVKVTVGMMTKKMIKMNFSSKFIAFSIV